MNKSIRLRLVVLMNSRDAVKGIPLPVGSGKDGLSSLFVPKATQIAWDAMHRRLDYCGPDAEEFKPDRWLDQPEIGAKGLRPTTECLPFNGGAEICMGQHFALIAATYATVRLCQAFNGIESRAAKVAREEKLTLTYVKANSGKASLFSREA